MRNDNKPWKRQGYKSGGRTGKQFGGPLAQPLVRPGAQPLARPGVMPARPLGFKEGTKGTKGHPSKYEVKSTLSSWGPENSRMVQGWLDEVKKTTQQKEVLNPKKSKKT